MPRVTVLITNFNLGRYLPETLASVAASSYPEIDVVLVDDASTDPFDHGVLAKPEAQDGAWRPIRVVRNAVNRGLPASRNVGLRHATGEYVLPLDADDCISSNVLEPAMQALERHPEFDVVVPTAGYFQTDEALGQREFCDFACFLGDAPSAALVANRISCATSLMRRSLFEHFRRNELGGVRHGKSLGPAGPRLTPRASRSYENVGRDHAAPRHAPERSAWAPAPPQRGAPGPRA
jgi:glycosyltransferase involved in cell wall biosynthesis